MLWGRIGRVLRSPIDRDLTDRITLCLGPLLTFVVRCGGLVVQRCDDPDPFLTPQCLVIGQVGHVVADLVNGQVRTDLFAHVIPRVIGLSRGQKRFGERGCFARQVEFAI